MRQEDRETLLSFEAGVAAIPEVIQAQRLFGDPDNDRAQFRVGSGCSASWRLDRGITEASRAASDDLTDSGVASSSSPPPGFHSVTPRMVVADAKAQVEFLRAVFDAAGDIVPGRPAEVRIGDSVVMVSPAGERELFPAYLYVYVDDADRVYRRATDAGAVSIEAPFDTPYGDRRAMVRDPFGNVFQIAHRIPAADSS